MNTTSYPTTDGQSTTPYVRPFDDAAITVSAIFLLAMMVFGIFANLVTIIVIVTSPRLRSIINLLIASLCVSDLLSALVSPLFLYRRTWGFDEWLIPGFLCKVFWAVDIWTTYATSFHVLLFAIIRLISIKWAMEYKKVKMVHIKIIAAVIWLVTFCCGFVPRWVWCEAKTRDRHAATVDAKWPACTLSVDWLLHAMIYMAIAFPIFIYLPMILIALLSPTIAVLLVRQRTKRFERKESPTPTTKRHHHSKCEVKARRREKRAIMQLAFITGAFMFGNIPITAYTFYTMRVETSTMAGKIFDWNFGMVAYILLRLTECMNPIFYNIASAKMRRETFAFLKRMYKCCIRPIKCIQNRISSTDSNSSESVSNKIPRILICERNNNTPELSSLPT